MWTLTYFLIGAAIAGVEFDRLNHEKPKNEQYVVVGVPLLNLFFWPFVLVFAIAAGFGKGFRKKGE